MAALPPPAQHVQPNPALEQRIPHPLGDAYLFTPPRCQTVACPLVVVSHTRGRSAADFAASPFVRLYQDALTARGFAVLLSNDAGPRSWGGPAALAYLGEVQRAATARFAWNGHTYAFGLSMGGLAALQSALDGPYPVRGVALLDAHVSVQAALEQPGDPARRAEVEAAYGLAGASLPPGVDTLDRLRGHPLPLFIAGSPDDRAVPFADNGLTLWNSVPQEGSRLFTLSGPHLGGAHFAPDVVNALADFFMRLETAPE